LRKLTAIVVLATFFISQYAKQAGYLECRLANYFSTDIIKCDCEKILLADTGDVMPIQGLPSHNHLHLDELFYPSFALLKELAAARAVLYISPQPAILQDGMPEQIDRPPQFFM
jgi:hypothetical protein